jgi:hypothetical protein
VIFLAIFLKFISVCVNRNKMGDSAVVVIHSFNKEGFHLVVDFLEGVSGVVVSSSISNSNKDLKREIFFPCGVKIKLRPLESEREAMTSQAAKTTLKQWRLIKIAISQILEPLDLCTEKN